MSNQTQGSSKKKSNDSNAGSAIVAGLFGVATALGVVAAGYYLSESSEEKNPNAQRNQKRVTSVHEGSSHRPVPPQRVHIAEKEDEQPRKTELECVLCLDRARSVLYLPCRHLVCCEECTRLCAKRAEELDSEAGSEALHPNGVFFECPLCRKHVTETMVVYT